MKTLRVEEAIASANKLYLQVIIYLLRQDYGKSVEYRIKYMYPIIRS